MSTHQCQVKGQCILMQVMCDQWCSALYILMSQTICKKSLILQIHLHHQMLILLNYIKGLIQWNIIHNGKESIFISCIEVTDLLCLKFVICKSGHKKTLCCCTTSHSGWYKQVLQCIQSKVRCDHIAVSGRSRAGMCRYLQFY